MKTCMILALYAFIPVTLICPLMAKDPQGPSTYTYRVVDGRELKAYAFTPEPQEHMKPFAAVLLFHGGGWKWGNAEWTFEAASRFAELGMVAFSIEYRLSDADVTPVDAIADTKAAFKWVREQAEAFQIDPKRVVGYGVSAGGHLVAAAATMKDIEGESDGISSRPNALLLWSPALDVAHDGWFIQLIQGKGNAADYSPEELAGKETPPSCIVMGEKDTLTPLVGAEKFHHKLEAAGIACELNTYPGVGHLLTRNLENQLDNYDPDPKFKADGKAKFTAFLQKLGYIK